MTMISSIGLYRNKAKNVIALSRILLDKYDGKVPLTREGLIELPGVGNKTASVVLNELEYRAGHCRRHPRLSRLAPAGPGRRPRPIPRKRSSAS